MEEERRETPEAEGARSPEPEAVRPAGSAPVRPLDGEPAADEPAPGEASRSDAAEAPGPQGGGDGRPLAAGRGDGGAPEPRSGAEVPAEGRPGGQPRPAALPPQDGDRPGLVDWVFGAIVAPRATFGRLASLDRPPLGMLLTLAIVITAVSGLVQGTALVRELAVPVVPGEEPMLPPEVAENPAMALALGAVIGLFGVVMMFVGTGFLHLVADLVGGQGSGAHLLAAMALASLPPNLIGIPLEALATRLGPSGGALRDLGAMAMGIWSLVLTYRALRATKALSRGDALLVLFVPVLAFMGLLVLTALILAGAAVAAGLAAAPGLVATGFAA